MQHAHPHGARAAGPSGPRAHGVGLGELWSLLWGREGREDSAVETEARPPGSWAAGRRVVWVWGTDGCGTTKHPHLCCCLGCGPHLVGYLTYQCSGASSLVCVSSHLGFWRSLSPSQPATGPHGILISGRGPTVKAHLSATSYGYPSQEAVSSSDFPTLICTLNF